jgi:hypothetical protein
MPEATLQRQSAGGTGMRLYGLPRGLPLRTKTTKLAALLIVLSGAFMALPSVSSATSLVPPVNAVRDSSPPLVLHTQNWFFDLFRGGAREPSKTKTPDKIERKPESVGVPHVPAGTYRTLCVRLCDGFYWPLSHSTTRARFSKDAKQCEDSCPGRSQLFVQRSGSDDVEGMMDLKGVPYTQLRNALRYRTEYVQDCTCRGNPWEPEAIARHRGYADAARSAQEKAGENKRQATPVETKSQSDRWARAEARDSK